MNIAAEGMYISAEQEIIIDAGHHLEIRADVINLKPKLGMRKEVLIDGNAGVGGNLNVVGGAHVEGELSYIHATAPKHEYLTETGYGPVAHAHRFFAPPWKLVDEPRDVRENVKANNELYPAKNEKNTGQWIPG
jgi:hypothetical protein